MIPIRITNIDYPKRLRNFFEKEEVKAYTMAILSFFAISFFTIFFIKPTLITFFSLQRQLEDLQEFDEKLEEKINHLLQAQEKYQTYKKDLSLLEEALPKDPEFILLVKKLENLSEELSTPLSKLEMTNVDFISQKSKEQNDEEITGKEQKDYLDFSFSFFTSGLYLNNESLLKRLINLRRIVSLSKFEIKKAVEENNEVEMNVEAKSFYLK